MMNTIFKVLVVVLWVLGISFIGINPSLAALFLAFPAGWAAGECLAELIFKFNERGEK
jgi:hypothetical protein